MEERLECSFRTVAKWNTDVKAIKIHCILATCKNRKKHSLIFCVLHVFFLVAETESVQSASHSSSSEDCSPLYSPSHSILSTPQIPCSSASTDYAYQTNPNNTNPNNTTSHNITDKTNERCTINSNTTVVSQRKQTRGRRPGQGKTSIWLLNTPPSQFAWQAMKKKWEWMKGKKKSRRVLGKLFSDRSFDIMYLSTGYSIFGTEPPHFAKK